MTQISKLLISPNHYGHDQPAKDIGGMTLSDIDALCRRENSGILPDHLFTLLAYARQNDTILSIRPVDAIARYFLELGYPTKGLAIKLKSASWGLQIGHICADQALSKLAGQPEQIAKYNQLLAPCLQAGHAQRVPLQLPEAIIHVLLDKEIISDLRRDAQGHFCAATARGPDGISYHYQLSALDNGSAYLVMLNGKPVEVLAPVGENQRPLMPDYDLFIIGTPVSEFGPQDLLFNADVSHDIFRNRIDSYQTPADQLPAPLREAYFSQDHFYKRDDATFAEALPGAEGFNRLLEYQRIGNYSPRISQIINDINQLMVGHGEWLVHHASDVGNPATCMAANFPATFILPKPLGDFNEVCIVNDVAELKTLLQCAKDHHYYVPLNPLWEKEITGIRSATFAHARETLSQHWQCIK